jgi:hypothetical protein
MMWHRLAALWRCPVRQAQEQCSSREFNRWVAYWSREPWGAPAEDARLLALIAALASIWSGKKGRRFNPRDFLWWLRKVRRGGPHHGSHMEQVLKAFTAEQEQARQSLAAASQAQQGR